uniref:Proepiregulin n=1 Tax=Varanus komodoensis TaxID=61221 RepID=A0A8D2LPI8_VARKO
MTSPPQLFVIVTGTICWEQDAILCPTKYGERDLTVQTKATTQAAEVVVTSCQSGMQNYCFNGQCVYIVDLKQHYCKCKAGYVGVRCGHSNLELVHRPLNNEYLALTILMVLFIFLAVSVGIYFSYRWGAGREEKKSKCGVVVKCIGLGLR